MKLHGVEHFDKQLLNWCNLKIEHERLDRFFGAITHLGGAVWTTSITLLVFLFAPDPWKAAGLCSLLALSLSHVTAEIIKKKVTRIRPYMVLPHIRTGKVQLRDHSFPSGHTTAIFSVIVPFVWVAPWLSIVLIPLAFIVGISRIYLGMHYPSDCIAGSLLGTFTALLVVLMIY